MTYMVSHSSLSLAVCGFGTYLIPPGEDTYKAVTEAIEVGYRSIDTAQYYQNERDVGRAVANSSLQIQMTTKVWNDMQGYQKALDSARKSRDLLGVDTIDLLLIHWPGHGGALMLDTWRAFERLKEEGTVAHIGVSNFTVAHLTAIEEAGMTRPAVNQVELNPLLTQEPLRHYCNHRGIIVEAWSPLVQGHLDKLSVLQPIARKYNKTIAQVTLRWAVSNGIRVLPKSTHKARMMENINIFDFDLSDSEIKEIDALNQNFRCGPDPDEFLF